MANYYADEPEYNPNEMLLNSATSSLANILGGYLGAKLESDRIARKQRSIQALARTQGINKNNPDYEQFIQMDPNEQMKFLNWRRLNQAATSTQQQREQKRLEEEQSLINYARLNNIDPNLLQGLNNKEARAFIDKESTRRQSQSIASQKTAQRNFNKYEQDILKAGGTREDARMYHGIYSIDKFKKKKTPSGLPTETQRIYNIKKRYEAGKIDDIELKTLESVNPLIASIVRGDPITKESDDIIKTFVKQQAIIHAKKSPKFASLLPYQQVYKIEKAKHRIYDNLGYVTPKPNKQIIKNKIKEQKKLRAIKQQEALLAAQQPSLLSRVANYMTPQIVSPPAYRTMNVNPIANQYVPRGGLQSNTSNESMRVLNQLYRNR